MEERLRAVLKWCEENRERLKGTHNWSYQSSRKTREVYNRYHRKYRKENIKNILNDRMRHSINYTLRRSNIKRQGKNWRSFVSYTIEELENRLKKTIPKGYTWNDFLEGKLDIDHIRPIILFNFNSPEDKEFQECWALNNLRLLTVNDNRSRKFNVK